MASIASRPGGDKKGSTAICRLSWLAASPVLPYDRDAALWHGAQRAHLEARGQRPPLADGQIAAIAATQKLVLVTRNTADFATFEGLEVRNWFSQP